MYFSFMLLFGLLVAPSVIQSQKSLSSVPCVRPATHRSGKIVGGENAQPGETPYIVSLTRRGGHFCGATIINDRWLLTAAHCICNGLNKFLKPAQIKAFVGLYTISSIKNPNAIDGQTGEPYEVTFKDIVVHPEYECSKVSNDIALLELQTPIAFTDIVKPMCIALSGDVEKTYAGNLATVSGWGWTKEDQSQGVRADVLQKASVEIWNNEKCQSSYVQQEKPNLIGKSQMCAGLVNGGVDSCWADSGGPLVTSDNILVGVVSTGVGCARPGLPGIYTRVSEFAVWIEATVLKG